MEELINSYEKFLLDLEAKLENQQSRIHIYKDKRKEIAMKYMGETIGQIALLNKVINDLKKI